MQPLSLKKQMLIIKLYFQGFSYDQIAAKAGVSKGTVANVISEVKAGCFPEIISELDQVEMLRELAVDLKHSKLTPMQSAIGLTVLSRLQELKIEPGDIEGIVNLYRKLTVESVDIQTFTKAALYLQELRNLKLPAEMAIYWICCFYSNYHYQNNVIDLAEVKGPPFLEFPCPSHTLGGIWKESIENARSKLMENKNLKTEDDLVGWFWDLENAKELGEIALNEVRTLDLKDYYSMAWVCCFIPQGAKWMANRSIPIFERFPQFADRRQFVCSSEYSRRRVRAYPFVIDWVEGADAKYRKTTTMWDLQERGINLGMESDPSGNIRMSLSWRPELIRINELRQAVEYAQRYYLQRGKSAQSTPLNKLIKQFIHKAKVIPDNQRKKSAQVRYSSGEAAFEQLLCEEALTPDVQKRYKEYRTAYQKSPAMRVSAYKNIRKLRKEVYDRVRS